MYMCNVNFEEKIKKKIVWMQHFSLNGQFFGPNLPKKGISGQKQKIWTTSPLNSAYWNCLGTKFHL